MTNPVQPGGRISQVRRRAASTALALAIVLVPALVATHSAYAQFLTILKFTGQRGDGATPFAPIVFGKSGEIFGTTTGGGDSGQGTVFKLGKTGKVTTLHSFAGYPTDGAVPYSGLFIDSSGTIWGTTSIGGADDFGTVYKLDATGKYTLVYSFKGQPDAANPLYASLEVGPGGNLIGTSQIGGFSNLGAVYAVSPTTGQESVLHDFAGGMDDGARGFGAVAVDKAGDIFGTTLNGGPSDAGTVWEVDKNGAEKVLYGFSLPHGAFPVAGVVRENGKLYFYGTTEEGGNSGHGTIYGVSAAGKEKVLYNFPGAPGGAYPFAPLLVDKAGNLIGTTWQGGVHGLGTVFMLTKAGKEKVLHSFAGGSEGANPIAGLVANRAGDLFGTTMSGGGTGCGGSGCGTVFRVKKPK